MGADEDALILLLIVLVADALLAGLPVLRIVLALPRALVEQMGGWFDRKLNREERSVANRLLRGALVPMICYETDGLDARGLARGAIEAGATRF